MKAERGVTRHNGLSLSAFGQHASVFEPDGITLAEDAVFGVEAGALGIANFLAINGETMGGANNESRRLSVVHNIERDLRKTARNGVGNALHNIHVVAKDVWMHRRALQDAHALVGPFAQIIGGPDQAQSGSRQNRSEDGERQRVVGDPFLGSFFTRYWGWYVLGALIGGLLAWGGVRWISHYHRAEYRKRRY